MNGQTPVKPEHGQACNGCGVCCFVAPCPAAVLFLGADPEGGRCPALVREDDLYRCGLVLRPTAFLPGAKLIEWTPEADANIAPFFRKNCGIGTHCDADRMGEFTGRTLLQVALNDGTLQSATSIPKVKRRKP